MVTLIHRVICYLHYRRSRVQATFPTRGILYKFISFIDRGLTEGEALVLSREALVREGGGLMSYPGRPGDLIFQGG